MLWTVLLWLGKPNGMKTKTLLGLLLIAGFLARADNWPQWRGPEFNGSSKEKNLPSKWTKESVAWAVDMPGPSAATPVVYGDKVFVSSVDTNSQSLHAICLDRKTGKVLWNNRVSEGLQRDNRSNFASPSPVADANRVYFFYGNGTLVCYDHAGKQIWNKSITKEHGEFSFLWTFSTSPLLYDGRLYMQVLQRNSQVGGRGKPNAESYLLAMDPATGKDLWKHVRPSEAVSESLESFTTPIPYEYKGRKEILIAGGDCITGHDAKNGNELWRWGTWNPNKIGHWRLVPSPVAGNGVVLACAPKGEPIYAVKAGLSGTLTDNDLAWKSDPRTGVTSDVPTPLFYDGDFFVLSDVKRSISRVVPQTGQVKWTVELPGRKKFEASPLGADGKVYVMNFAGDVTVLDAAKGEILNTVAMGEPNDDATRSSIAAAGGHIFIRTNNKLFAVAQK